MADVMPDYMVEIQKLRVSQRSMEHNLERYRLELLEVESRKAQAYSNIAATRKALKELGEKLDSLIEAHGEPDILEVPDNG